jgi:hypothetical protein
MTQRAVERRELLAAAIAILPTTSIHGTPLMTGQLDPKTVS